MEEIRPKDYVVGTLEGKPSLIRVLRTSEDVIFGVHEYKDEESKVQVRLEDVRANLGRRPHIGTVYGAKTERLIDVDDFDPFFQLEWYFDANQKEKKAVLEGLATGVKNVNNMGLGKVMEVCKVKVVLNTAKNLTSKTTIGTYRRMLGTRESPDEITVRYHADSVAVTPYLLAHEVGHGVWRRLLSVDTQVAWIKAFAERSEVEWFDSEQVGEVIRAMVSQETTRPQVEDEHAPYIIDWVLSTLRSLTNLRPIDVHTLLRHDKAAAKRLLGDWRSWSVPTAELDTAVTEYANTNPEECFCECLALRSVGKGLPDYIKDLWNETHDSIRGRAPLTE